MARTLTTNVHIRIGIDADGNQWSHSVTDDELAAMEMETARDYFDVDGPDEPPYVDETYECEATMEDAPAAETAADPAPADAPPADVAAPPAAEGKEVATEPAPGADHAPAATPEPAAV